MKHKIIAPKDKFMIDLELQKRLDDITKNSVKESNKEKSKQAKIIPDKSMKRMPLILSPENLYSRDKAVERNLDRIANNAIVSSGEAEFLGDYQAVPNNVVDDYLQKAKAGDVKLIGASYIPDLEALPVDPFQDRTLSQQKQLLEDERKKIVDAYQYGETEIKDLQIERKRLIDEYNIIIPRISLLKNKSDEFKLLRKTQAKITYDDKIAKVDKEIENRKKDLSTLQSELNRLHPYEYENDLIKRDYEAEKSEIERRNKEKIRLMEKEFNTLNMGKYSVQQGDGETDDEYKTRMESLGNIDLVREDFDEDNLLYQSKIFKNKMKEIIRQPDVIETVLKGISDNYHIEGLTYLNEVFPFVKSEFIKTFGQFPTQISPRSVLMFLKNTLLESGETENITKDVIDKAQKKKVKPATVEIPENIAEAQIMADILWNTQNKEVLVSLIRKYEKEANKSKLMKLKKEDLIKYINDQGYAYEPEYDSTGKITKLKIPGGGGGKKITVAVKKKNEDEDDEYDDDEISFGLGGKGLKHIPKLSSFGKIHIKPYDLFYNNKLAIRDMKGRSLTGFPDVQGVSEPFVSIVLKVLKGDKPTNQDYKNLLLNERPLFDSLMYQSKLHKVIPELPINGESTLKDLKHRLNLLEGEINAGNTNDDIKKELHGTVHKLVGMGALNNNVARNYLQDIIGNIIKPRKGKK